MSDENVIHLEDRDPHYNVWALCLNYIHEGRKVVPCHNRWIATVYFRTSLFKLQCPLCGGMKSFGSLIPADYLTPWGKNGEK